MKRTVTLATCAGTIIIGVTWCIRDWTYDPRLAIWSGLLALVACVVIGLRLRAGK